MNESLNTRWLRWSLTAIALLLAIIAIELSAVTGPILPRANAAVPDSGLQRLQLLEAQKETNVRLDRILKHLQTQTIKVEVASTDKDTKKKTARAPRAPSGNDEDRGKSRAR